VHKYILANTQGPALDAKLRELFKEIDVDNSAGSDGLDPDELRIGIQVIYICILITKD
jgi:hypothetical protein